MEMNCCLGNSGMDAFMCLSRHYRKFQSDGGQMKKNKIVDDKIKDLFERYPSVDTLLREACYLTYMKCNKKINEQEIHDIVKYVIDRIHGENIYQEWYRRLKIICEDLLYKII